MIDRLIEFDTYSLLFLIVIVVLFPTALSFLHDLYTSTLSLFGITTIILIITSILALFLYFSATNSYLSISNNTLNIKHWIYSREILKDEVREINFIKVLGKRQKPRLRVNGISIGHVHIGNYILRQSNKKAFFMFGTTTVSEIITEKEIIIISTPRNVYEKLQKWHNNN